MPVLNSLQYKQFLSILTLSKCNAYIIDQIFTIYRPQKSQMVKTVQIELSINSNTVIAILYDSETQLIQFTD